MLRFIIIPIAIMIGYLILMGMWNLFFSQFTKKGRSGGDIGRLKGSDMVMDPNCQTYLPKERAIHSSIGGEDFYFCSQHCLKEYQLKRENQKAGSSND